MAPYISRTDKRTFGGVANFDFKIGAEFSAYSLTEGNVVCVDPSELVT